MQKLSECRPSSTQANLQANQLYAEDVRRVEMDGSNTTMEVIDGVFFNKGQVCDLVSNMRRGDILFTIDVCHIDVCRSNGGFRIESSFVPSMSSRKLCLDH